MLVPSDWRLLAEGNAHFVYRYVGRDHALFSGMVLKLPKNNQEDRLLYQHKFVRHVVTSSPFAEKRKGSWELSFWDNMHESDIANDNNDDGVLAGEDDDGDDDEDDALSHCSSANGSGSDNNNSGKKTCCSAPSRHNIDCETGADPCHDGQPYNFRKNCSLASTFPWGGRRRCSTMGTRNNGEGAMLSMRKEHQVCRRRRFGYPTPVSLKFHHRKCQQGRHCCGLHLQTEGKTHHDVLSHSAVAESTKVTASSRQRGKLNDRGLVNPAHLPPQHLHLFENRETYKLREAVEKCRPPLERDREDRGECEYKDWSRASSSSRPLSQHDSARGHGPEMAPLSVPLNPVTRHSVPGRYSRTCPETKLFSPTTSSTSASSGSESQSGASHAVSTDPFASAAAPNGIRTPPNESFSSTSSSWSPSGSGSDQSSFSVAPGVSSFVLLEKDLITPPVPKSKLLTSSETRPAWSYFTAELKPKSGLPALIPESILAPKHQEQKGASDATKNAVEAVLKHGLSRFTLLQFYRQYEGKLTTRSSYAPERLFSHLSERQVVVSELEALLEHPQNNWRLFMDGTCLHWKPTPTTLLASTRNPLVRQPAYCMQFQGSLSSFLLATTPLASSKTVTSTTAPRARCEVRPRCLRLLRTRESSRPKESKPLFPSVKNQRCSPARGDSNDVPSPDADDSTRTTADTAHDFPAHLDVDMCRPDLKAALQALTHVFAEIIHKECNLLHRLQFVHALAEGQQELALKLVNQLRRGTTMHDGFSNTKDEQPFPSASLDVRPFLASLDDMLCSDNLARAALQEFLIGMESEIAASKKWAFSQKTSSTLEEPDAEALLARRLQAWHWRKGAELLEQCTAGLPNSTAVGHESEEEVHASLSPELAQSVLHWIYRFLIGRTFLDCSIMINVVLTHDAHLDSNDVALITANRFALLCRIPLNALHPALACNGHEEEGNGPPVASQHRAVLMESPSLSERIAHALRALKNPVLSTSPTDWTSLYDLLQVRPDSEGSLSVWYRVSVVDLDLKQASKIPGWARQLETILDCYGRQFVAEDTAASPPPPPPSTS